MWAAGKFAGKWFCCCAGWLGPGMLAGGLLRGIPDAILYDRVEGWMQATRFRWLLRFHVLVVGASKMLLTRTVPGA